MEAECYLCLALSGARFSRSTIRRSSTSTQLRGARLRTRSMWCREATLARLRQLATPLIRPPALTALSDQHSQLERLLVVQPRIYGRPVSPLQVCVGKATGAPRALGNVLAGELDMHAAEVRPHFRVDPECQVELFEDVLKPPRLQPTHRGLGIPMHGIADPQHRLAGLPYRLDRARE